MIKCDNSFILTYRSIEMHEHLKSDMYVLEHIDEFVPISLQQKEICQDLYGFPRQIIEDPLVPRIQKEHMIERLIGCITDYYLSNNKYITLNEYHSGFQQQERHW